MRYLIARCVIVLTSVACSAWPAMSADPRPEWYPPDAVIQKQIARREEKRRAAEAYYLRVLQGQYEKVGSRAPQWDRYARDLFKANIEQRINMNRSPDVLMECYLALGACGYVGCTDPFIKYLYARSQLGQRPPLAESCRSLLASKYQGLIRYNAHLYLAVAVGTAPKAENGRPVAAVKADLPEAERNLEAALKILPEIIADRDLPDPVIASLVENAADVSLAIYKDRWRWTQKVYGILEQQWPDRSALLAAKGELFAHYAWDARGGGFARTVTDEGWELMEQRLAIAEEACTKAWDLDDQCIDAAVTMLMVELGQGKGRNVMEHWFRRAVAVDPRNYQAYAAKRHYLEPKWYGSAEEMMGFAREVAATLPANWRPRLIVLDGYMALARQSVQNVQNVLESEQAYFREHPEAWREIQAVCTGILEAKEVAVWDRLNYARAAVSAGDLETARKAMAPVTDRQGINTVGTDYRRVKAALASNP